MLPLPPTPQQYISQSCITHPSPQGLAARKFGEKVHFKNNDSFRFVLQGTYTGMRVTCVRRKLM
jgi:hypothetical protein